MYERLHAYISNKVKITEAEFLIIKSAFSPKKLRKKEFLLQEGEICKTIAFVASGALRLYSTDTKGHEHVMQFALENWWITDRKSLMNSTPSEFNIEALEESEVLLITREGMSEIEKTVPAFLYMIQGVQQNNFIAVQSRVHAAISFTAEEKYNSFMKSYPDIFLRVPLHMIASYLGITPETLSRIRKQQVKGR
jgi:CRP-like cAMP-binding protein